MPTITYKPSFISRGQGKQISGHMAYITRASIIDESTGRVFKYRAKEDLVFREILLPNGAPAWMGDYQSLASGLERAEKRKDGRTALTVIVSIPREIPRAEWQNFGRDYAQQEFLSRGLAVAMAGHDPRASDGKEQPHIHYIISTRAVDAKQEKGFAERKSGYLMGSIGEVAIERQKFADFTNAALERHGSSTRVSHLTLRKQFEAEMRKASDPTLSEEDREIARARAILLDRDPEPTRGYKGKQVLKAETGRKSRPIDTRTLEARKAVKSYERSINRASFLSGVVKPILQPAMVSPSGGGGAGGGVKQEKSILDTEYDMTAMIKTFTKGVKTGAGIAEAGKIVRVAAEPVKAAPGPEKRPQNLFAPNVILAMRKAREDAEAQAEENAPGKKRRRKRYTAEEKSRQQYAIQRRQENASGKSETRPSSQIGARDNPTKGQT